MRHALNILFVSSALALISTLPYFAPENIFTQTGSRIQTPTDVLFTRLATIRPDKALTATDNALRRRLASLDGRCLYLAYGPSTSADCGFCNSDDPQSYLYYTLPIILLPYILNFCALGLATSSTIAGKEGSRWRTPAVIVGAVAALADCYFFGSYNWQANARVARAEELDHFYWRMRIFRGLTIALIDAGFAGLLWGSSTNRVFIVPPSSAERLEHVTRILETTRGKLGAVGIVRNVMVRDESMRRKGEAYWKREGDVMREVMDEREVIDGMRSALASGRISVATIEEEATKYANGIVGSLEEPGQG